jgi:hypothetical protein
MRWLYDRLVQIMRKGFIKTDIKTIIYSMSVTLGKVGRFSRKKFIATEETLIDVLEKRLRGEKNVSVRRHIRQKLKLFA